MYPAELENVIHTHDSVSEVGVVGVPDEVSGENTRAYIVLKQGVNNIKPEDIQQYVASKSVGLFIDPSSCCPRSGLNLQHTAMR